MTLRHHILAASVAAALAGCGGGDADTTTLAEVQSADGRARALAVTHSPASGVLRFDFGPQNNDAKIIVGPAQGTVTVEGLSGVPNGTTYTGVRAIEWRSGAGTDRLVFEVTQSADFDLTVDTGAGDAEIDVKWIAPAGAASRITPSVFLATGPGMKKVQVQLESFGRDVAFDVATAFGAGDTEFKGELQYKQGSVVAGGRMALDFGAGLNKVNLLVDSEAQQLDLDLAPRFMGELNTTILSDDPSSSARVRFAPVGVAGGSKIGFEMLTAAPSVTLDHDVTGGAGMDEVKLGLTSLAAGTVTSTARASLGQSMDKLELAYKGLPTTRVNLSGAIGLGAGDDEALLLREGISTTAPALDCGDGLDKAIGWPAASTLACELF
jgi:hypothetical protein